MGRVQDCVARQFSSLWPLSICKGHETGVAGQLTGGLSVIPNTYGEGTTMTEISLWVISYRMRIAFPNLPTPTK